MPYRKIRDEFSLLNFLSCLVAIADDNNIMSISRLRPAQNSSDSAVSSSAPSSVTPPFRTSYGPMTKFLARIEGLWAKNNIHLAQEPRGDRQGVVTFIAHDDAENDITPLFPAISMAMMGDSLTVGCGTTDQKDGFAPAIATELSTYYERDVQWATFGKLGATMRRVRYRLLPELAQYVQKMGHPLDIVYICAASNDVMAQRDPAEYVEDLAAVLDDVKPFARQIIVLGPAQFYTIPSLGKNLHKVLYAHEVKFIRATKNLCDSKNIEYLDMTQADISDVLDRFYASDNFHPNKFGYQLMGQYTAAHTRFVQS